MSTDTSTMGKTIVTMVDNRPPDHSFIRYSSAVAQHYADSHGYDFLYQMVPSLGAEPLQACLSVRGNPRHVAWAKLLAVFQLLSRGYEQICYIDTDVMFTDIRRGIRDFVQGTPLSWGSRNGDVLFLNNKPYGCVDDNDMPCSGVILIKSGEFARDFLGTWYELEIPKHDLGHPWEQNALWELFRNYPRGIGVFDSWMFRDEEGQWVRHVPHDQDREQRFAAEFCKHPGLATGVRATNVSVLDTPKAFDSMASTPRRRSLLNMALKSRVMRRGLYVVSALRSRGVMATLRKRLGSKR
jgi:hypothetical protein